MVVMLGALRPTAAQAPACCVASDSGEVAPGRPHHHRRLTASFLGVGENKMGHKQWVMVDNQRVVNHNGVITDR